MPARVAPLLLAAATVLALSGGSCSSDKSNGDDRTLPTTRQPTTTTAAAPADPYAIPKVIDEAYVNRVLAALDQIEGDVLRDAVEDGAVGPEERSRLRAIYNDPQFEDEFASLVKVLPGAKQTFQDPPGNRRRNVTRLVAVQEDCIFLEGTADFSQVLKAPSRDSPEEIRILTLRPTQEGADPGNVNPTPWSISNAEIVRTGYEVPDRARCDT